MTESDTFQWLLYPECYKLVRMTRAQEPARPPVELEQFIAVTYSPEDVTMICTEATPLPGTTIISDQWRVLQIKGPYEEQNIKLVSEIARILRQAHIEIFHPAAFDTDYVLLKHAQVAEALDVLERAEYDIDQRKTVSA